VDVNKTNIWSQTPFFTACQNGHIEIVKLLVNNKRVDINKASFDGTTPLLIASKKGYIEIVQHLLASTKGVTLNDRDLINVERIKETAKKQIMKSEDEFQLRFKNCENIVELLKSFKRNPNETRFKLRLQLGFTGKHFFLKKIISISLFQFFMDIEAASVFATIVLLSDNYLNFKKE